MEPVAAQPRSVKQPRMDWMAEMGGCIHFGEPLKSVSCGCTAVTTPVHRCSHPEGTGAAIVLQTAHAGASRKDRKLGATCCETCPLRTAPSGTVMRPADAIRHVIGHLYPLAKNDTWRWNLDQLAKHLGQSNGRRIISIALDSKTVPRDVVEQACSALGLEMRFVDNSHLGEVASFVPLVEALGDALHDPRSIVYYWHGKGVSYDPATPKGRAVRAWTQLMWDELFGDQVAVDAALSTAAITGVIRQKWPRTNDWHYAGTFFAWRPSVMLGRNWTSMVPTRYGVERWPGTVFTLAESSCLTVDELDVSPTCLYQRLPARAEAVDAAIIITCGPGYDRWVRDAIASAIAQEGRPEIVCVFDRCEPIDLPPRVRPVVVDHGSVQLARRAGLAATTGEVICFLDADNAYDSPSFVRRACEQLRAESARDKRVAGLAIGIEYFDHEWKKKRGLPNALIATPWDRAAFLSANCLDASVPVLRHALEASWNTISPNGSHEDYHMWRQLVLDGWTFQPGTQLKLKYRMCPGSSTSQSGGNYAEKCRLHDQSVTLFVPLSGRAWAWPSLHSWLTELAKSERGRSVRLVLCDTSGDDRFHSTIRREAIELPFEEVRIYRQSVAVPGLADQDRKANERAVQLACSRIYNRFAQECSTPLALIIEDDILPQLSGEATLRALIDGLDEHTIGVSGVYYDRRTGEVNSWTSASGSRVKRVAAGAVAGSEGYLPIKGTGFGCLLIRSDVLRSAPLGLPPGEHWYDPCFFKAVLTGTRKLRLACGVTCDHRSRPEPGGAREYRVDWFSRGISQWEQFAAPLAGQPVQLLEVGSFEGMSACWMADNLMTNPDARLTCIDAGSGVGFSQQLDQLRTNLDTLPNRNQVDLRIGSSFEILPTLTDSYDLIYIDGSHLGGDTIRDLCNAWPLLRAGGLMFVDDYQFEEDGVPPREWAGPAIDYWLSLRGDDVDVLHLGYQMVCRRVAAAEGH